MSILEVFLKNLYLLIAGKDDIDNNIIRKHTRKLLELGEFSFPLDKNNWHNFLDGSGTIFHMNPDELKTLLVNESKLWPLHVRDVKLIKSNCHLYLSKPIAFKLLVTEVLERTTVFGSFDLGASVCLQSDGLTSDANTNLTDLRLLIIKQITEKFLLFTHSNIEGGKAILFTNKSSRSIEEEDKCVIVVGAVLSPNGTKDVTTTAQNLYNLRTVDMRLMAEHKYGIRVTTKPGWEEFFSKLGSAAVTIDLLQNKISNTVTIDVNNHYLKNASFILYNCARLSALFKEFDKKVANKIYPPLPGIDETNFDLLTQPEEWELLFVYVLQYPSTIKSCIKDILNGKVNIHYLVSMLSSMASLFSIYYRRVRILTEPKEHLYPILSARIYLLKAVEQVLHNSLNLLNIQPVKQM